MMRFSTEPQGCVSAAGLRVHRRAALTAQLGPCSLRPSLSGVGLLFLLGGGCLERQEESAARGLCSGALTFHLLRQGRARGRAFADVARSDRGTEWTVCESPPLS